MIKNALAALAVLSLVPSAAVAVEANLAKTPTSTLTYTIRAKDTAPTDILSMGGAASCSVVASLASGSVSVVPRADASVAHSTATAGTVTLGASGPGTLTSSAGQFSVSFTAVGKSTVTVACTPGGSGGGAAYDDTAIQAEVDANTAATTHYFLGATGDGVTDDQPVLQAEIDRLGALPIEDRVLRLPPGNFRIGDSGDNNTGQFYTGSLVIDELHGFKIIGAGRGITNFIIGSDQGQSTITVCDISNGDVPGVTCVGGSNITRNITISDLSFVDNDPIASGGQHARVFTADVATGTAPVFGEIVSWSGGSGYLIEVGSSIGAGPRYVISRDLATGVAPSVGATLTGAGGWTAANVSLVRGEAVEGSHGLVTKYVDGLVVERVGCVGISDECLDLKGHSDHAVIRDFHSVGVGSVDEGGSAISISSSSNVVVDGFYIDLGNQGIMGGTSAIDLAQNNPTHLVLSDIHISNGVIVDTSTDEFGLGNYGLKLNSQSALSEVINVTISNVSVTTTGINQQAASFSGAGGANSIVVVAAAPVGTTPTKGQLVTWTGGSGTLDYVGSDVGEGSRYVFEYPLDSGVSPAVGVDLIGPGSVWTASSTVEVLGDLGTATYVTSINLTDSDINGRVDVSSGWSAARATNNAFHSETAYTFGMAGGLNYMAGNTFDYVGSVNHLALVHPGRTITGNRFGPMTGATAGDCIDVGAAAHTTKITGNHFNTCGAGGGDHAVNASSSNTNLWVEGNTFLNAAAGTGFRMGGHSTGWPLSTFVGGNCVGVAGDGSATSVYCGDNIVEN